MSKNIPGNGKHLSLSDRSYIESELCKNSSFANIAKYLCKDPSSIGKEVLKHRIFKKSNFNNKLNNYCAKRFDCVKTHICFKCNKHYYKNYRCASCHKCNFICDDFIKETCKFISNTPYVCNGCEKQKTCHLDKYFYIATIAHKDYKTTLIDSRQGINIDENKLKILDATITPLIKNGQSPYQILANNKHINLSIKSIYNYIEFGALSVKNIDLPKKIKYKKRHSHNKVANNKKIFENKTYTDFLNYVSKHPNEEIVEMDTVIGNANSNKVLLTMIFKSSRLMLAFLLDKLHYLNVKDIFDYIEYNLGTAAMYDLMPIILTDRGFEFNHPQELEYGIYDLKRTKIFYCDAMAPYQKGTIEKNHEYIRKFFKKGTSFDNLTQKNINLMLSHINSTKREILNNMCPIEVFLQKQNDSILELFDIHQIAPDKIILKNSLFNE